MPIDRLSKVREGTWNRGTRKAEVSECERECECECEEERKGMGVGCRYA